MPSAYLMCAKHPQNPATIFCSIDGPLCKEDEEEEAEREHRYTNIFPKDDKYFDQLIQQT